LSRPYLDLLSADHEGDSLGLRQMFYDGTWDVQLVAPSLVDIHGRRELLGVGLPLRHDPLQAYPRMSRRGFDETRAPLRKAKAATPDRPIEVFTDGMKSYPHAVRRELAYRSGAQVVNPHHWVPSIRAPESNNLVERLH
jgi:hypothetical protein